MNIYYMNGWLQKIIIPATLIETAATFVVVCPQVAIALSPPEVNKVAYQITVRIGEENRGSGVIIGRQGKTYTVLTNWHVVEQPSQYTVQTFDGEIYYFDSSQVKRLVEADLAVVYFTSGQEYPIAYRGNSEQLIESQRVYLAGYPGSNIPGSGNYRFYSENIIGFLSPSEIEDGYELIFSGEPIPGMSGGPILDDDGQVVGIYGRVELEIKTGAPSLYGIPITTAEKLAIRSEIPLDSPLSSSSTKCKNSPSPVSTKQRVIRLTLEKAIKIAHCNDRELEVANLFDLDVESIANRIRFQTTLAFYELQKQRTIKAIKQATIEDASQTLKDAQLLEQAGLGTRFDVLKAEVELKNAYIEANLTTINLRVAEKNLAEVLNQNIEIINVDLIEKAGPWYFSLEKSISLATKNLDSDEFLSSGTESQIRLQVETAYNILEANEKNIEICIENIDIAEESLRLARLRFQAGVGSQTDVISSQTKLSNTRGNYLDAIIEYNKALNSLQYLIGYPLELVN